MINVTDEDNESGRGASLPHSPSNVPVRNIGSPSSDSGTMKDSEIGCVYLPHYDALDPTICEFIVCAVCGILLLPTDYYVNNGLMTSSSLKYMYTVNINNALHSKSTPKVLIKLLN